MDPLTLKKLNQIRANRRAAVVVTNLSDGRDRVVEERDEIEGALGEATAKAFRTGKSGLVEIGDDQFFLNAHLPPPRLVVIGAVHISQALAPIASISGYDLEVIDPRTAFATPERFEGAQVFADWPEEVLKTRPLDAYCAVAAITHDPKIDDAALVAALEANCFYVGALGSRKTHAKRVARLSQSGLNAAKLDQIHAPIGLDIGAATPAEIAVAIMAQIVEAFRRRGVS